MPTGAVEVYADVAAALGTRFQPQLREQFNRSATALALIRAEVATNKVPAWDVEFSDGTQAASYAEGSDVQTAELGTDKDVPATLGWARYRAPFALSDTEIKAAMAGIGSPRELENVLGHRMTNRAKRLAEKANQDFFAGDGTDGSGNATIVGLYGGALDATTTYATIDPSTYPEWAAGVLGNGGTPRPITEDLLDQADDLLFTACGLSADFGLTTSAIRRKYAGLFTERRDFVTSGEGGMRRQGGFTEVAHGNATIIRDKDATAGKLVLGVRDAMVIQYLPPLGASRDTVQSRSEMLRGASGGPNEVVTATQIPFEITPLAKTGNSVRFNLSLELQLCVLHRNRFVVIEDIAI